MLIIFLIFWIILNGKVTLEIVLFGLIISSALNYIMDKSLGFRISDEISRIKRIPSFLRYIVFLIIQVIKANIYMINLILSDKVKEVKPVMFYSKLPVKNTSSKILIANSITLTPGTITVHLEGDIIGVHAIDKELVTDFQHSAIVERVKKLEKEG